MKTPFWSVAHKTRYFFSYWKLFSDTFVVPAEISLAAEPAAGEPELRALRAQQQQQLGHRHGGGAQESKKAPTQEVQVSKQLLYFGVG